MGAVFSISGEISNHNCLQYTNLVTSALPPSPYYGYFLDLKNSAFGRSKKSISRWPVGHALVTVFLSVSLFCLWQTFSLSGNQSSTKPTNQPISQSVSQSLSQSVSLLSYLHTAACLLVCLSACLSVCLSVSLAVSRSWSVSHSLSKPSNQPVRLLACILVRLSVGRLIGRLACLSALNIGVLPQIG